MLRFEEDIGKESDGGNKNQRQPKHGWLHQNRGYTGHISS